MVRWMRWHCPSDTGFKISALAVWDRAGYLSVTEAPLTILNLYEWAEKKNVVSLKLEGQSGVRTRDLPLSKHAALTAPGPPGLPGQCGRETVCFAWTVLNQQRIELIRHWANASANANASEQLFWHEIFQTMGQEAAFWKEWKMGCFVY